MKKIYQSICLLVATFLLIPCVGFNQNYELPDSLNTPFLVAARAIMDSARTCALITIDAEGRPRARTMDPFLPEDDFTVWFGTNLKSRKVDQIKKDPRVTLYYLAHDGSGYVVLHGTAQLVDKPEEKEKWWKDEWEMFYPNKREDYLLIKVSPEWLEVISYAHGVTGDPVTWETPRVIFKPE